MSARRRSRRSRRFTIGVVAIVVIVVIVVIAGDWASTGLSMLKSEVAALSCAIKFCQAVAAELPFMDLTTCSRVCSP
jgi:uncharacterized membrane protein YhhN